MKVLVDAMDRLEIAGLRESFSKTRVFYFITMHFKNFSYYLYHAIHLGSLYIKLLSWEKRHCIKAENIKHKTNI